MFARAPVDASEFVSPDGPDGVPVSPLLFMFSPGVGVLSGVVVGVGVGVGDSDGAGLADRDGLGDGEELGDGDGLGDEDGPGDALSTVKRVVSLKVSEPVNRLDSSLKSLTHRSVKSYLPATIVCMVEAANVPKVLPKRTLSSG